MKYHFIAIGGSIMHQLALQLHAQGHSVTGSDDAIFDPALTNLKRAGICPSEFGWFPEKINEKLDFVVLGKHAHADNIELAKARALDLKVITFPELIYDSSKEKTRIVVGGSHGKTTTTSMLVHTFIKNGLDCDYMVGAKIEGVKGSVKLNDAAQYIIIEGDEYPTSAEDPRPKLVHYQPSIAILTGVAWDHMNVFPTFEIYKKVFADYIKSLDDQTDLVYFAGDELLSNLVAKYATCQCHPYQALETSQVGNDWYLISESNKRYPTSIYGQHNMQNLAAAKQVWTLLGRDEERFYDAASSFNGAAKRLEYLADKGGYTVIKDYAHSPSKVRAAVAAVRERYKDRTLAVICELHTYSSLNKDFIPQYKDCLRPADMAAVHYDPAAMKIKRMPPLAAEAVKVAFHDERIIISNTSTELQEFLDTVPKSNVVILMMSSGNYGGIDLDQFSSTDKSEQTNGN
jgi:UDP-N-acetylmuramate: L-alanyl-gamma-D-glutamyl-meso-diaminopimelate ligase